MGILGDFFALIKSKIPNGTHLALFIFFFYIIFKNNIVTNYFIIFQFCYHYALNHFFWYSVTNISKSFFRFWILDIFRNVQKWKGKINCQNPLFFAFTHDLSIMVSCENVWNKNESIYGHKNIINVYIIQNMRVCATIYDSLYVTINFQQWKWEHIWSQI